MEIEIQAYAGDFEDILPLFLMSTGMDNVDGVRRLIKVEQARGTHYFTAVHEGRVVGMIGVYFDDNSAVDELEPPQIIDVAVLPAYRKGGVARRLMEYAVEQVRAAGRNVVWLYTDGNSAAMLNFYRRLNFQMVAVVPDYFGKGTLKAIYRRDI
jgi:ribosomal protein S18 acetylase RimI-like enzyme